MKHNAKALILCLALPLIVGGLGSFFTMDSITTWYAQLKKPWFNPPNQIFGPVWTVLYLMMGYASYLIYSQPASENRSKALKLYLVQLIFNFFWSIIFFYYGQIGLALIEILLLWVMINLTIIAFSKVNKNAAYLLLPYVVWVSFASILNAGIYLLNR